MNKKIWTIAIVVLVFLAGAWLFSSYNRLVTASEQVDSAWAQVETQYQRSFDLIPNLVSAVKGSLGQEQKIFGDLAAARANYSGAKTVDEKAVAAGQVESSLSRLLVIMESYPELKSNENIQTLMAQLEGTENRISVERGRFNEEVKGYNTSIKRLPLNIVAGLFGYYPKQYFEIASGVENPPAVDLNLGQ